MPAMPPQSFSHKSQKLNFILIFPTKIMIITFPSFLIFSITLSSFLFCVANARTFEVTNNCVYPVWAAAVPGGGQLLSRGQTWKFDVKPGTTQARIWGRTGCNFDGNGRGRCRTGDCNGLLRCQGYGQPPNTLAEYALNQFGNKDFFDISLVDGFNIPMEFSPTTGNCRGIKCVADINGQCPNELKADGGCNNPCTVFRTDQYCCNSGNCEPTSFSKFFKKRCPDAYSYPKDDPTSTFTCPNGADYRVVFCPAAGLAFKVQNQCPYTVWAAAIPGGGERLEKGETWTFDVEPNTILARVWGRTNCTFNENGVGKCETGDCGGQLKCETYGAAPVTVAEYALNQFNGRDFFDITLVDGFNIPIGFNPVTGYCPGVRCAADIMNSCPSELRVPGGCNDPCTVFKTDEYCCNSGNCGPTPYSRFFKNQCPEAYTYPMDNSDITVSCPGGTSYMVTFCP